MHTQWTTRAPLVDDTAKLLLNHHFAIHGHHLEPIFHEKSLQIEKMSFEKKIAKFEPFKKYLNFFTLSDTNKLSLKSGNSVIKEKIIIPEKFLVQLSEGQSINFMETGSIFSYSPFEINGTKENPVRIFSSDSSGQGLHLIQGNSTSKFNYLEFINQSSFMDSNTLFLLGFDFFFLSPYPIKDL